MGKDHRRPPRHVASDLSSAWRLVRSSKTAGDAPLALRESYCANPHPPVGLRRRGRRPSTPGPPLFFPGMWLSSRCGAADRGGRDSFSAIRSEAALYRPLTENAKVEKKRISCRGHLPDFVRFTYSVGLVDSGRPFEIQQIEDNRKPCDVHRPSQPA